MNITTTLAYIDAGTGAMVLQGLIGLFLGGLYMVKLYWYRITGFFTGNKPDETEETEATNDD